MNKKVKSVLSVFLVIIMTLSLGISAFADETEAGAAAPAVCTGDAAVTDCAAEMHVEGCPKYVSAAPHADETEAGAAAPAVCTGDAAVTDCAAETHVEGCPKYVSAAPHADEAEADAAAPVVCTGDAAVTDCAAETHVEGCPKYVGSEIAGAGEDAETDEEKAAVQARIDALPEKADFAAMSVEEKERVASEYAAILEALNKLCETEGIEDGDIGKLNGIDLEKLIALSDAINEYAAAVTAVYVAWIGDTGYETLTAAVSAANSGDTITLGEGNFTLYGVPSQGMTSGKDLTFVGQGVDKTAWNIGAEVPDPAHYGTEYNGDYSFDGAGTVTFKNMTFRSGSVDYLGFIRAGKTVVDGCIINGKTFYWGYSGAIFNNTTFNCPDGDYAVWTYSSPVMTFNNCTFNSSGKVINVYTDYCAGKSDIAVNFNNCTVNSTTPNKSALNINDSNMGGFKYIIDITTAPDKVTGLNPSGITCSRLFGFSNQANNTGRSVVSINGKQVWRDGEMVGHAIDCDGGVKYTDGYNDNAFIVNRSEWVVTETGRTRTVTSVCSYCGYKEERQESEKKILLNYHANGGLGSMEPDSRFGDGAVTAGVNAFNRDGYEFTGWNTNANGTGTTYKPGAEITLTDTLTLYAQWEKIVTYTVTYTDGVDNLVVFQDQVYSGLKSGAPTPGFVGVPERRGYRFVGWEPSVTQTVTGNVEYKAVWERNVIWSYDPGKGPKTGDESNLALWTALMLGAASGVVFCVRKRRSSK